MTEGEWVRAEVREGAKRTVPWEALDRRHRRTVFALEGRPFVLVEGRTSANWWLEVRLGRGFEEARRVLWAFAAAYGYRLGGIRKRPARHTSVGGRARGPQVHQRLELARHAKAALERLAAAGPRTVDELAGDGTLQAATLEAALGALVVAGRVRRHVEPRLGWNARPVVLYELAPNPPAASVSSSGVEAQA